MSQRRWIAINLAFLSLVITHCANDPGGESTAGKADDPSHHIEGNPTNGPSPFQWYDASEAEIYYYKDIIRPADSMVGPAQSYWLLPASHELTVRLQTYIDDIDTYIRQVNPTLTQHTPKPKVRIFEDPSFLNAWASGVPVCIDSPVVFDEMAQSENGREYFSVSLHHAMLDPLDESRWIFGQPPKELEKCAQAPYSSQVQAFVDWMNQKGGACHYALTDGVIHISGAGCAVSAGKTDFARAKSARYYAVIPYVFIAVGFLKFLEDESQIVGVLAHELGHYYKSHSTNADFELTNDEGIFDVDPLAALEQTDPLYNFFFTQQRQPTPEKPVRRNDSDTLRDQVLKLGPNQTNPFKTISGLTLDPSMARFILSLVAYRIPSLCEAMSCDASCAAAARLHEEHRFSELIYEQQLEAPAQEAYREIEALFLKCSAAIQVTAQATPGALSLEDIVGAFSTPMKKQIEGLSEVGTLQEIAVRLDQQMRVYAQQEETLYRTLESEHIGLYSAEQEADELAIEFLANIGLDPLSHALTDLKCGRYREAEAPEGFLRINGLTMDRCTELFENDFIDSQTGEYVFVPLGNLTSLHHGSCYRAFNSKREIAAHGYQAAPVTRSFPKPWSYYLELIKAIK